MFTTVTLDHTVTTMNLYQIVAIMILDTTVAFDTIAASVIPVGRPAAVISRDMA
jgi:hypothetical protein